MPAVRSYLNHKRITILFFGAYFILGLLLAGDYGIHWDDHSQYNHGLVTAEYLNELTGMHLADHPFTDQKLERYRNRAHGVVFPMLALGIQELLGIEDPRGIFLLRHYLTFIIFFIGLIFFFRLLKHRFDDPFIALFGVILMILSPRIFADSFYNSKDIVFLSLTIISLWTLVRFLQKMTFGSAVLHALACALLIDTRIIGVFMPFITVSFLFLKVFGPYKDDHDSGSYASGRLWGNLRIILIRSVFYLAVTFLLMVIFWPYLWADPFRRTWEIFTAMSHFNWDDLVLFRGNFIEPSKLPFYYIPFWILITTPLLYSFFFLVGLADVLGKRGSNPALTTDRICLAVFFLPLLSVIALKSVLYDGWRQMFFLYVPFLILALVGLDTIIKFIRFRIKPKIAGTLRWILFGLLLISLSHTAYFMIKFHPHENVYFNCLAGKETTKNFEADYWGLSYLQVLEYLLKHDQSDTIKVCAANWPGQANADILRPEDRKRIEYTSLDNASYFISNYRFYIEHGKMIRNEYPYDHPVYEIKVRGNRICGAYRLTHGQDN